MWTDKFGPCATLDRPAWFKKVPNVRQSYVLAARRYAALTHPNIVAVYDLGFAPGGLDSFFVFIEPVEGVELGRLLEKPGPLESGIRIIEQLLGALDYAHRHSVAHHMVAPENISFMSGDQVKVWGFGVAIEEVETRKWAPWEVPDCAHYLAPEQACGESADMRSDVYAAGVLLHRLACGRAPFSGNSLAQLIQQHLTEIPRDAREIEPGVSQTVALVIARCLEKDPSRRFADAGAMASALGF